MADFKNMDNHSNDPLLCANNCGFFGNPATRSLCSVCYKDFLKQNLISNPPETDQQTLPPPDAADETAAAEAESRRSRCGLCNRKIGLLGFKCRCGGWFCVKHRFQKEHGCEFDLKRVELDKMEKEIVEIKADKLENRV